VDLQNNIPQGDKNGGSIDEGFKNKQANEVAAKDAQGGHK
jgi:hypothetical protein